MPHQSDPAYGQYSRMFISDVPAGPAGAVPRPELLRFAEEAIYIYSFAESRMVYANGWKEVLGYEDAEVSLIQLVNATTPEFAPFSNDLNDKAIQFLHSKSENLEQYSFSIELKKFHKLGHTVPLLWRVGVYKTMGGKVVEVIGRAQVNHALKFGKVMKYATYGPADKVEFEEELNKILFQHPAVSEREKEALALASQGYSFKEIAALLNISESAVEKRIRPMYKRFDCKSLSHLVKFGIENGII
ncbi:DNA-binding CsgD family transcriptional regulator [Filimonas zeae]|uniref:HTH luxR-type domain-containing protein n=1 Tax=Filimonas zeae TaxID=1737353 RepID=A0A917IZA5_9BACT|nr:helix-turn-helix transcriptional regulator [Filimonas zeae]MDR6340094.1 DNA-binding CsgD family transcriptional regulator [Filimonas zeae]GGH71105.1 hypothetical protein GCM10011379_30100 [Filimonas zeae]